MTKDLLKELTRKYKQYVPIMEHIEWNGSYMKDYYTFKDLKLYWWTSLIDMHAIETMIYAEGLILLFHNKLTYEYMEIACLKIILKKAKGTLLDSLDIDSVKETIRNTYNHIMKNKEEILKSDKDWRPKMKYDLSSHTHKKKLTKKEFISILDECKEKTDHRSYSYCLKYFIEKTGLSKKTYQRYLKEYDIEFDEREKSFNTGRKASTWPKYIEDEEWILPIKEIATIIWNRCNWVRKEGSTRYSKELSISESNIKKYKAQKMKELGLKKKKSEKSEKKIIPDFSMDFSCHQIQ